jgi:hypothetical protein
MFHHSQVLGPDITEIRRGDYDYCGISRIPNCGSNLPTDMAV